MNSNTDLNRIIHEVYVYMRQLPHPNLHDMQFNPNITDEQRSEYVIKIFEELKKRGLNIPQDDIIFKFDKEQNFYTLNINTGQKIKRLTPDDITPISIEDYNVRKEQEFLDKLEDEIQKKHWITSIRSFKFDPIDIMRNYRLRYIKYALDQLNKHGWKAEYETDYYGSFDYIRIYNPHFIEPIKPKRTSIFKRLINAIGI